MASPADTVVTGHGLLKSPCSDPRQAGHLGAHCTILLIFTPYLLYSLYVLYMAFGCRYLDVLSFRLQIPTTVKTTTSCRSASPVLPGCIRQMAADHGNFLDTYQEASKQETRPARLRK